MNDFMEPSPFFIKDCALVIVATGAKARTLIEFRHQLASVSLSSIYHHCWSGRLRPSFEHQEYHNDFSNWAHQYLHDDILAERLELLAPSEYPNIEDLRSAFIDVVDERIDEKETFLWTTNEGQFHFVESKIIIFQTQLILNQPEELLNAAPLLTKGSLFYHFIDSTRRLPEQTNDFSVWLQGYGEKYEQLAAALNKIDPHFISLTKLQRKMVAIVNNFLN